MNDKLQWIIGDTGANVVASQGIDWVTLTETSEDGWQENLWQIWLMNSVNEKPWSGNGYRGHMCKETKIRYGERSSSVGRESILIASGGSAGDVMAMVDYRLPENMACTRVDLQVTVELAVANRYLATQIYDALLVPGAPKLKYNRSASLVRSETGDTLYIGRRGTDGKFFRLYDKGGQSGSAGLGSIWRLEVQYNRKLARSAMEAYQVIKFDPTSVAALVSSEFADDCGFTLIPTAKARIKADILPIGQEPTSDEQKLNWLRRCVWPVIRELRLSGRGEDVDKIIGLGGWKN